MVGHSGHNPGLYRNRNDLAPRVRREGPPRPQLRAADCECVRGTFPHNLSRDFEAGGLRTPSRKVPSTSTRCRSCRVHAGC